MSEVVFYSARNDLSLQKTIFMKYNYREKEDIVLRDQAVSYCPTELQDLKNRLIASIERCGDEKGLEQCAGILHTDTMPCIYTDNEFIQVLADAETGGNACEEDVRRLFAGWGVN